MFLVCAVFQIYMVFAKVLTNFGMICVVVICEIFLFCDMTYNGIFCFTCGIIDHFSDLIF